MSRSPASADDRPLILVSQSHADSGTQVEASALASAGRAGASSSAALSPLHPAVTSQASARFMG
jgi:hypothetical protein